MTPPPPPHTHTLYISNPAPTTPYIYLTELEMLGLELLLDQMVLLRTHLDQRVGGGDSGGGRGRGGRLFQAVQHLPDVELLHFWHCRKGREHTLGIVVRRDWGVGGGGVGGHLHAHVVSRSLFLSLHPLNLTF